MTRRSLPPFTIACTVIALAFATAGPAHAASCKKYKETSGCKVPNGTSYQVTKGANDEMNVTVYRGRGQFTLRSRLHPVPLQALRVQVVAEGRENLQLHGDEDRGVPAPGRNLRDLHVQDLREGQDRLCTQGDGDRQRERDGPGSTARGRSAARTRSTSPPASSTRTLKRVVER